MPAKIPKPLSMGEETMAMHLSMHGIQAEREYAFAAPRKWKLDFAIPEQKIGIEVEGGKWQVGRHQRPMGFERDCRKYSHAALLGWRVLRFTTDMVMSGEAIDITLACIQGRSL
jgi:very-short-patch-repair endonuclease